jgi:hypothetical protein
VSQATDPDLIGASLGWGEGTTDADLWTALRFVLGRPGWRVEPRTMAQGRTYLRLATTHSRNGRQRLWRMDRSREGVLVHDKASGRRLGAVALPTVREALVRLWEAAGGAGPE